MIWDDMRLAYGEGTDALNGRAKERAATIRKTIPGGSYIADWHYASLAVRLSFKNAMVSGKTKAYHTITF